MQLVANVLGLEVRHGIALDVERVDEAVARVVVGGAGRQLGHGSLYAARMRRRKTRALTRKTRAALAPAVAWRRAYFYLARPVSKAHLAHERFQFRDRV